jgi:hypothetical protein
MEEVRSAARTVALDDLGRRIVAGSADGRVGPAERSSARITDGCSPV